MILYLFFIFIKLSLSINFTPLPKGNGILNSPYEHKSTDNLFFIFEHFRHGARSPCNGKFINNTDELGGKWKNYGALTKVGIKQHYLLGLKNRKRYNNFISNQYNSNEIKIFSSDYNRTMMSAQAQLLGFYNIISFNEIKKNDDIIGEEKIINKMNLNSIIPPINLFDNMKNEKNNYYEMTFSEKFKCPLHKEMIEKNIKAIDELKTFDKLNNIKGDFNTKYFDTFLREFNIEDYTLNYTGMYTFCDIFIAYYFDNGYNKLRINNLEKKYKFFNSTEILNMCYDFFTEKFYKVEGDEYAKDSTILIMSKLMKNMVNYMQSRINKKDPKYIGYDAPKFVLYSGHDDTLTQMGLFFNKFFNINIEWFPYASTQVFEIRKYGNQFYVELYYNDRLKMNITFQQFSEKIKKTIMSDEEIYEKCYSFRRSPDFHKVLILFLILVFLFMNYISIKFYYYCFGKSQIDKPSRNALII